MRIGGVGRDWIVRLFLTALRGLRICWRVVAGLAVVLAWGCYPLVSDELMAKDVKVPVLPEISRWGYQLQKVDPLEIGTSAHDLVVIDYSRDGSLDGAFSRVDVRHMQTKPGGGRRLVLAYLSIGEAEDYRDYWQKSWGEKPPGWLMTENPEWKGNYPVRYWERDWQAIIDRYLLRIISAGFDGVYLDRIDVFDEFPKRPSAKREMVDFVAQIARRAVMVDRKFYVVAQNAESLLSRSRYRGFISAIAKEDLLFGLEGDGVENTEEEISWSRKYFGYARQRDLPVLVIEYLSDERVIAGARRRLKKFGYIPAFSIRALDRISID